MERLDLGELGLKLAVAALAGDLVLREMLRCLRAISMRWDSFTCGSPNTGAPRRARPGERIVTTCCSQLGNGSGGPVGLMHAGVLAHCGDLDLLAAGPDGHHPGAQAPCLARAEGEVSALLVRPGVGIEVEVLVQQN